MKDPFDKCLLWQWHRVLKKGTVDDEIDNIGKWKKYENRLSKTDYLLAMERSPIKDVEIKELLKQSLTDKIDDREVYIKGIDNSYMYEGYLLFKTEEL